MKLRKSGFLSILLSLCLLCSLMSLGSVTALAAGENSTGTVAWGVDGITYSNTGAFEDAMATLKTGDTLYIKLLADTKMTEEAAVGNGDKLTLDLAGHTLTAAQGTRAFWVEGNFTLNDSSGTNLGKITGGGSSTQEGGAVHVYTTGSFVMNGGTITGNDRGAVSSWGSFIMTGGAITGNTNSSWTHAGVQFKGGTVELSGNINISGNRSEGLQCESDLFINTEEGLKITIGSDGLNESARIGIYVNSAPNSDGTAFTSPFDANLASEKNFFADQDPGSKNPYTVKIMDSEGKKEMKHCYQQTKAPTADVAAGTYEQAQTVTLTTETYYAWISYTTDGSDPLTSQSATKSRSPVTITVSESTKVRACAFQEGAIDTSDIVEWDYVIETEPANPEAEWQEESNGEWKSGSFSDAVEGVYDGGTIRLLSNVSLSESKNITKSLTITSKDKSTPCVISSSTNQHGYLLCVQAAPVDGEETNAPMLTLANVVVDGGSKNNLTASRGLISVGNSSNLTMKKGILILDDGAVLQNNSNTTSDGVGGAVAVIYGEVIMNEGALIQNCAAEQGGAVAMVNSSANQFTMYDGEISGNQSTKEAAFGIGGGAIYQACGTFNVMGGEIKNNTAIACGGAVYLVNAETVFEMSGGIISGNTANYGSGIYNNDSKAIHLTGGTITGNKATKSGGGVYMAPKKELTLSGNITVAGNTSGGGTADDLYLESYPSQSGVVMPEIAITGPLTGRLVISTWMKPGDRYVPSDELLIVSNGGYTITESDAAKLYSQDKGYELELKSNNTIVMKIHSHSYTYTASENVVYESCTCGHSETATISATDGDYDGVTVHDATIGYSTSWLGGDLSIAYSNGGAITTDTVAAGDYVASITKSEVTARVSYTVNQAIPTISQIPTASRILVDGYLSGSTLNGGKAVDVDGNVLDGTFTWKDGTKIMSESGVHQETVVFTPDDGNYGSIEIVVDVEVYTSPGSGTYIPTYYTLTFDVNEGSAINSIRKVSGSTVDLSDYIPTKDGYTFNGWYSDEALTTAITSVRLTKNTTVFAGWTKNAEPVVNPFRDIYESDWYYDDVMYVYGEGLMQGTAANLFSPDVIMTRGMIVTILYRMEGEPSTVGLENPFTDLTQDWYVDAVKWAAAHKIVLGYGNGKYGPEDPITREQMSAILWRYAKYKGIDVSADESTNILSYNDVAEISEYAIPAMQWTCGEGIIEGWNGNLMPKGNAKRCEVAAILHRYCNLIEE